MPSSSHSWIEISREALVHNLATFRGRIGPDRQLMAVVKANAYGHGMEPVARVALEAGADQLAVFDLNEALRLRDAGIQSPILVFGPTAEGELAAAAAAGVDLTVAGPEAAAAIARSGAGPLRLHLKLECGTYRQGFAADELEAVARLAARPGVTVAGVYTHFADIEDTTDHTFAREQLATFEARLAELAALGVEPTLRHTACSAATLLFERTYFEMVRIGISLYGLWPSKETLVSAREAGLEPLALSPVMTWKCRVAQVKSVPAGATVGYGRTFKTTRPSRLAVLPIGYANGYDRQLSNNGHVLIRGQRAKLCGRVMMNVIVVDVTDIPQAAAGDEGVLLGAQGEERITAEMMASWLDTINYEVVTRAEPHGERRLV